MLYKRLLQRHLMDPFDLTPRVARSLPRLPSFFNDFFTNDLNTGFVRMPRYDLKEEGNKYLINVEVPGFTKDQIQIQQMSDYLKIVAESNASQGDNKDEETGSNAVRRLEQTFSLPANAKSDSIKASLDHGVLKLAMDKTPEEVGKNIQIE
eukprot:NODE_830_length_3850_cov_0.215143.p3 type:complete len:151 gc:universal NODE_830_length_3850_cov_0.215143:2020-2472(+)